jgi:hypothetical protein
VQELWLARADEVIEEYCDFRIWHGTDPSAPSDDVCSWVKTGVIGAPK